MADFELTRWGGSDWEPLVRGQRVTVTHGDVKGEFQVTEVTGNPDGGETYALRLAPPPGQPIGDVPLRDDYPEVFDMAMPGWLPQAMPFRRGPLTISGQFSGTLYPGAAERLTEAAKKHPEYCNVCEGFPCLGGHPPAG